MSALRYLTVTTFKNKLKELKKHPSKLIAYVLFVALMVILVVSGNQDTGAGWEPRPMEELGLIVLAFYGMIFVVNVFKGFFSGATFFTMADVNFLFSAPIRPKRILFYGLIHQVGMTLYVGFFIFFEYGILHNTYGVNLPQLFLLFFGYGITYFCAEITAMVIYIFVNGNPARKRALHLCLYAFVGLLVVAVAIPFVKNGFTNVLESLAQGAASPLVSYYPVLGWAKSFAYIALTGNTGMIFVFLGLMLAYIAGTVLLITKLQSDYYEDVLQATETTYAQQQAAREGKIPENSLSLTGRIKRGSTGIKKGQGAGVFYYKHILENRRTGMFFFDRMSLLFLLIGGGMAFFMKDLGIIGIFSMFTYFQLFTSATGRWLRELGMHYVYLIPERPFSKLVRLCAENICKVAVDAVVTMLIIGVIIGASPIEIAAAVLARFGFGMVFMSGNILSQRLFGSIVSKGLLMFLYFLFMILICLPGIIGGILMSIVFPVSSDIQLAAGMFGTVVFNLLLSMLLLFLCRSMLDNLELNKR